MKGDAMKERKIFQLYADYLDKFASMSNEDMGILFKAILLFENGIAPEGLTPMAQLAFDCIKGQLEADMEAWEETKEARSKAAKKAAESRWNNAKDMPNDAEGCETHTDAYKRMEAHCDSMPNDASDAVTVTVTDIVKDIKEKDTNVSKKKNAPRFVPPTVEQVKKYCTERGNSIDAEGFVDFYTSKGWKVGNNPMKDWKAAVRNWERMDKQRNKASPKQAKPNKFSNFEQRKYDFADYERRLLQT